MPADAVMLVSRDPELTADVRRLCAAAGQELHVLAARTDLTQLRRRPVVLLVDAASPDIPEIADQQAVGRDDERAAPVVVLTTSPDAVDPWRTAVSVGARQVITLPQDSRRLLDTLALAREGAGGAGPLIGVIGGSGGVGASTFAAALAWAASAQRRTTLIDLDPYGGGADLLLGVERAEGLRWSDLSEASGVVPALALHERLPRIGDLGVLAGGRARGEQSTGDLPVAAVTAVVAASRRIDGAAVIDLPRWPTDAADAIIGACDHVIAVVAAEVCAITSAATMLTRVSVLTDDIRVVLRGRAHGRLGAADAAAGLGRAVQATLPVDARVAAAADRGELVAAFPRSQLGTIAGKLWSSVVARS